LQPDPYGYYPSGRELALALYPAQFPNTLAILGEASGDLSQNTKFVRAVGVPARAYLQENTMFDYSPPPAVFYAFNDGVFEEQPYAFVGQVIKQKSEITDSKVIAGLYQSSTTQTSYARDGCQIWFIRADDSAVCRFVEKTAFETLVK
jgi:hypothetical protein